MADAVKPPAATTARARCPAELIPLGTFAVARSRNERQNEFHELHQRFMLPLDGNRQTICAAAVDWLRPSSRLHTEWPKARSRPTPPPSRPRSLREWVPSFSMGASLSKSSGFSRSYASASRTCRMRAIPPNAGAGSICTARASVLKSVTAAPLLCRICEAGEHYWPAPELLIGRCCRHRPGHECRRCAVAPILLALSPRHGLGAVMPDVVLSLVAASGGRPTADVAIGR